MLPEHILMLSAVLFSLGVFGVLWNRGAITILMCVEIMLNAANLAFIAFSRQLGEPSGQIYAFFIMTLAAAEAAVGLAIVIAAYRRRDTVIVEELDTMRL